MSALLDWVEFRTRLIITFLYFYVDTPVQICLYTSNVTSDSYPKKRRTEREVEAILTLMCFVYPFFFIIFLSFFNFGPLTARKLLLNVRAHPAPHSWRVSPGAWNDGDVDMLM